MFQFTGYRDNSSGKHTADDQFTGTAWYISFPRPQEFSVLPTAQGTGSRPNPASYRRPYRARLPTLNIQNQTTARPMTTSTSMLLRNLQNSSDTHRRSRSASPGFAFTLPCEFAVIMKSKTEEQQRVLQKNHAATALTMKRQYIAYKIL